MAEVRRLRSRSETGPAVAQTINDPGSDAAAWAARARAHWARREVCASLEPYRRALELRDDPEWRAEYVAAVREWGRTAVLRPAWRLVLTAGVAHPGRSDATRLGGVPARPAGEAWPLCARHDRPLGFVGQLDLRDAPGLLRPGDHDLLLVFRCSACTDPAATHLVELRRTEDLAAERLCTASDVPGLSAWDAVREARASVEMAHDLPDWQDLGAKLVPHALAMLGVGHVNDDHDAYVQAHQQRFGGGGNLFASKLGGWPHWLHRAQHPVCPVCAQPARFFAQLDSEPDLGLEWGKLGCAYVFACADGCSPSSGLLFCQTH